MEIDPRHEETLRRNLRTEAVRRVPVRPAEPTPPRCPIRGHDHELVLRRAMTQQGTGQRADTWACAKDENDPSQDRYRWFLLRGRELSNLTRMKPPRFGWNSVGIDR